MPEYLASLINLIAPTRLLNASEEGLSDDSLRTNQKYRNWDILERET